MKRANLEVVHHALATKVLFEGTRAVGVEYAKGSDTLVARGGDVILCGGAFNSPQLLQLSGVGPADELTLDEHLRDRRPAGEGRQLLADLWIGQDVDRRHRGAGRPERAQSPVGVAAHDELRCALHEEAHRLVLDDRLDLLAQLAHVRPLVLIRSSWIDPSPSGAASAS